MSDYANMTKDELNQVIDELCRDSDGQLDRQKTVRAINRWLRRGDGVAVYENFDLGHPQCGQVQLVSFGSPDAQLEVSAPPERLPDIGNQINWRYMLFGVYRGEEL